MGRGEGSLARKLDFGESAGEARAMGAAPLRLAPPLRTLHGPDKYKILEHRRRQAQMAARRLLEVAERREHDAVV